LWACLLLGAPATAEAVFSRETAREILAMRGMVPAVGTTLIGIVLLRYVPTPGAPERAARGASTSRRFDWVILAAYILMIYATIPVGFQVVTWIVQRIGIGAFRWSLNALGLAAALVFLWYVVGKRRLRTGAICLRLATMLAMYVYFFLVLEVPVKRIHFLEYSYLSALLFRVLRPLAQPPGLYLWITLATTVVGLGEEGLSLFFPRRFAAISDLIWDTTAGVMGALVLKFILLRG
jgi:hypothetical protein